MNPLVGDYYDGPVHVPFEVDESGLLFLMLTDVGVARFHADSLVTVGAGFSQAASHKCGVRSKLFRRRLIVLALFPHVCASICISNWVNGTFPAGSASIRPWLWWALLPVSALSAEVATGAADERFDSGIDDLEDARARECEDEEPAAAASRKLSKGKKAKRAKTRKREVEDDGLASEAVVVETTPGEESNGAPGARRKDPSPKIASKVKRASKKRKHKPRSDDPPPAG